MASIEHHQQHPNISVDEHVKSRRVELGQRVNRLARVYLDKRFWIIGRDVVTGKEKREDRVRLFEILRQRARAGEILCPISETLFIELYKQKDPVSRRQTIALIDELSQGICLQPYFDRIHTEISYLFHKYGGREDLWPLRELVWSKVGYVFGEVHPTDTGFDGGTELAVQKAFFDFMWDLPLSGIEKHIGNSPLPAMHYEKVAESINQGRAVHQPDIKSFKRAYVLEMIGALELFMPAAREVLEYMNFKATGKQADTTAKNNKEHEKKLFNFFGGLAEKGKLADLLPTLHVTTLCHAEYRYDRKRIMTANDFMDFYHAASAVGYCDAFLTEKDLCNLLRKNHFNLSKNYSCRIETKIPEAIKCALSA